MVNDASAVRLACFAVSESSRMRTPRTFFGLVCIALALNAPRAATKSPGFFEQLTVQRGTLTWRHLRLGMTRRDAERALGRRIRTRKDEEREVCGSYLSSIRVADLMIELQWSSETPDAELEQMIVPFSAIERQRSAEELADQARRRLPELISAQDAGPLDFVLARNRSAALTIKTDEDPRFIISIADCID